MATKSQLPKKLSQLSKGAFFLFTSESKGSETYVKNANHHTGKFSYTNPLTGRTFTTSRDYNVAIARPVHKD
jgi:hypothetical protein